MRSKITPPKGDDKRETEDKGLNQNIENRTRSKITKTTLVPTNDFCTSSSWKELLRKEGPSEKRVTGGWLRKNGHKRSGEVQRNNEQGPSMTLYTNAWGQNKKGTTSILTHGAKKEREAIA